MLDSRSKRIGTGAVGSKRNAFSATCGRRSCALWLSLASASVKPHTSFRNLTLQSFWNRTQQAHHNMVLFSVNGGWTEWGPWTRCTAECEGGVHERTRNCTFPEPQNGGRDCRGRSWMNETCNAQPCPRKCVVTMRGIVEYRPKAHPIPPPSPASSCWAVMVPENRFL